MRILLVEDNPAMALSLRRVFEHLGHEVVTRKSRTGALAYHRRHGGIDVLVLDVGLPDGTGLDLLRELRAGGCSAQAFVITGRKRTRQMNLDAFELGAVFVPSVASEDLWRHHLKAADQVRDADERPLLEAIAALTKENDLSEQASTILFYKARGHTVDEIAPQVKLTPHGVRYHIRVLLRRTGHRTIRHLVKSIHALAEQIRTTRNR